MDERAKRAMDEVDIEGVHTTAGFLRTVLDLPELARATHHTTLLESWMAERNDDSRRTA